LGCRYKPSHLLIVCNRFSIPHSKRYLRSHWWSHGCSMAVIGVQCSYSAWRYGHHKWKIGQHRFILQLSFSDRSLTEKLSFKCFQSCQKLFFIFREWISLFRILKFQASSIFSFVNTLLSQTLIDRSFPNLTFAIHYLILGVDFLHQNKNEKLKNRWRKIGVSIQLFCGDRFTVIPSKCGFRIRLVRNFAQLLKSSSRFSVCGDSLCVELAGRAAIVTCLS